MKYNKLIRDKLPEIFKEKDIVFKIHIASEKEYSIKLKEKLQEEVNEYLENPCLEELADILEVIHSLCQLDKHTIKQLEEKRENKANKKGQFYNKIILEEVID